MTEEKLERANLIKAELSDLHYDHELLAEYDKKNEAYIGHGDWWETRCRVWGCSDAWLKLKAAMLVANATRCRKLREEFEEL